MNKLLFLVINGIALLDLAIGQGSKTAWRANLGTGMQGGVPVPAGHFKVPGKALGSSTRSITKPMPTKPAEESTMSKLKTLLDGLSASKLKAIADILKSKEPGPAPTEPSSRPPNVPSRSRSRSRPPPPPGSDNFGPPREARGRMRGPERRGPSSGPMDSRDQMRSRNGGGRNGPPPNMNGPPGGDRWGGPGGGNGRPRGGPPNAMSPQMLARLSRDLLLGPPGRGGAAASGGEAPEQPEPGTVNPMLMAFMMKQMAGGGSGAEGGAGGLGSFMGVPGANLMNMLGGSGGSGGAYMMQALGGGSGAGGGETPSGTGLGALASLAGGGGGLGGMNPAALAAMLGGASGSAGAEGGAAGLSGAQMAQLAAANMAGVADRAGSRVGQPNMAQPDPIGNMRTGRRGMTDSRVKTTAVVKTKGSSRRREQKKSFRSGKQTSTFPIKPSEGRTTTAPKWKRPPPIVRQDPRSLSSIKKMATLPGLPPPKTIQVAEPESTIKVVKPTKPTTIKDTWKRPSTKSKIIWTRPTPKLPSEPIQEPKISFPSKSPTFKAGKGPGLPKINIAEQIQRPTKATPRAGGKRKPPRSKIGAGATPLARPSGPPPNDMGGQTNMLDMLRIMSGGGAGGAAGGDMAGLAALLGGGEAGAGPNLASLMGGLAGGSPGGPSMDLATLLGAGPGQQGGSGQGLNLAALLGGERPGGAGPEPNLAALLGGSGSGGPQGGAGLDLGALLGGGPQGGQSGGPELQSLMAMAGMGGGREGPGGLGALAALANLGGGPGGGGPPTGKGPGRGPPPRPSGPGRNPSRRGGPGGPIGGQGGPMGGRGGPMGGPVLPPGFLARAGRIKGLGRPTSFLNPMGIGRPIVPGMTADLVRDLMGGQMGPVPMDIAQQAQQLALAGKSGDQIADILGDVMQDRRALARTGALAGASKRTVNTLTQMSTLQHLR